MSEVDAIADTTSEPPDEESAASNASSDHCSRAAGVGVEDNGRLDALNHRVGVRARGIRCLGKPTVGRGGG